MKISSIVLKNFRNYEQALIAPCPGVTVLVGDNAQGKTNVLEAVYLCCTGRSHRTAHDREMIRAGHRCFFACWPFFSDARGRRGRRRTLR